VGNIDWKITSEDLKDNGRVILASKTSSNCNLTCQHQRPHLRQFFDVRRFLQLFFFVTSENAIVIMHAPCEEHMKSAGDVVRVRNPCNTGLISLLLLDATRTDGTVLSCGDFGSTRPRSSQMALADPRGLVSSILTRLRRGLVLQKLTTRFESLWDMSTKSDDILVCQDANAAIAKLNDSMLGERMIFVREE